MREIKFRAWDKTRAVMRTMDHPTYTVTGTPFRTKSFGDFQWFFSEYMGDYDLMQYTGVQDKHGAEIYEGDIVKIFRPLHSATDELTEMLVEIKWVPETAGFREAAAVADGEVIGNIYENKNIAAKIKP